MRRLAKEKQTMLTLFVLAFLAGVYVGARFAHHPVILWAGGKLNQFVGLIRDFRRWLARMF